MSTAEALVGVSSGIMDDVQFGSQTVEFNVLLTQPNPYSVWLKDGYAVVGHRKKYSTAVEQAGLLHRMTVSDVQSADSGVYTIKLRFRDSSLVYLVEPNAETLAERLAEKRQGEDLLVAEPDAYSWSRFGQDVDSDLAVDSTADCTANDDEDFATEQTVLRHHFPTTRLSRRPQSLQRNVPINSLLTARFTSLPSLTARFTSLPL